MSPVLRAHRAGWVLAAMLLAALVAHPAPVAGWSLFGGGSSTKQPSAPTESDEQIDDSNLPAQIGIPQFEPGKQYSYKFDSQLAASLTGGEHFSVSRLSTNVKMQILDDSSGTPIPDGDKMIVMQCEQIQLAVSQQPISISQPSTTQQKLVAMDDLDAQAVAEKIQKAIQLPFQVRLAPSGRVKELRFSEGDADYSENIKRAIVNLIQVQQSRNESSTDGSVSPAQQPDQAISYKLLEKTIEGECEVAYTVIPDDTQQESQQEGQQPTATPVRKVKATVTKAVNTKKCKRRPEIRYNFLRHSEDYTASNALEAGQTPYEKEAVEVMSVYEFRIAPPSSQQISSVPLTQRDDNDDGQAELVITKAKAVSQLTYNLMDSSRPALLTYACAQLTLSSVDGKAAGEKWSTPANLKQWLSSLVHSVEADIAHERFIADGDGAYVRPDKSPYPSTERLPDIAVNVMRELMESAQVGSAKYLDMREESINHLEQFVSVLRLCTQQQLGEVRKKLGPLVHANTEQTWKNSKFLRDIFSDALTMACTQPSIAEFHEIIKAKQVSPSKAARAIRQLMHCRLVGQTQLDQVWAIRESEMAKKYSPLRHSCTLTWAAMAGAMCSSNTINATNVWQYEHPSQIDERRVPLDEPIHPLGGHADSDKWAGESPVDGRGNPSASTACPKEKRQEFVDKLAKIYDDAKPQQRKAKIVSIKSLGNLGLATGLPVLKRIMHSAEEEPLIKVQAIDAVRHISHKRPDAVQHALLPLFQDRSQPEEVRLNAFYQLLHAQPDPQMMEVVCREMQAEQNQHVKAFVQTAITNMANSRKHFDQKTASVLKAALAKLKAYSGAYDEEAEVRSASQLHQFALFSGDYTYTLSPRGTGRTEFGAGITTTAIYGKESALLPKEVTMAMDTLFDGRLTGDVAQISIQQQDLELGLQRIAEQIDAKNFDQVVTRSRRAIGPQRQGEQQQQSFNPYESMKQWLAKHRPNFIASNSNGNATNANGSKKEPLVLITARAYGQDIDFQLIDQSAFDRFIVNGRLDVAGWESSKNTTDNFHHHYAATLGPEFKLKVPSVAGIPVVVSKTVPALTACEGTTKLEFSPSGQSDKVRGVKYSANMQSQAAIATVYRMEAFSPLFTCGVNTRHSQVIKLPLNIQLKIGRGEGAQPIPSAELEVRLPKEDFLLAQSSSRPSTFTRVWPANGQYMQDKFLARSEHTLYLSETEKDQVDRISRFTCPLSGLVVETQGHWPRQTNDAHTNAQWMVGGENSMEVRVLPTQSPNAAGRLRFKLQLQQSSSEQPIAKQELTNLFDTQKELFADSSPQEKQLMKQFITEFNPRHANIATRMRFTAAAEQFTAPQQRGAVVELATFCDKRFYLCSANGKAEWKSGPVDGATMQNAMAVSQPRGGGGGDQEPYEISIRSSAQLTLPVLKGVFVGGIRSEHMLAHIQATVTGTEFNSPVRATLNLYAKPSRRAVMSWQMLLDEARQAGIVEFDGGMPKVLMFNDITGVAEFQSSSPAKAWLAPAIHKAKNYPQSYVQIEPNLDGEDEDEFENDSQQQQGSQPDKMQIYARFIADELVIAGRPAMLYNLTVRSQPLASGAGQVGNDPRRRGNSHFRVSNRHKFGSIDDDSNDDSTEDKSSRNKRKSPRRNINSSPRASLFDVFKSGGNNRRAQMAQCEMSDGRYVKSFDGKNYVIPLTSDCYTVMAKECGHRSSQQPSYSIMAKKTGPSANPEQQRIHLLLKLAKPHRQYELYLAPTAGQHQHQGSNRQHQQPQMIIKLDGEVLREEDFDDNDISVIDPNEGGRQQGGKQKSLKVYILHCSPTGAELQFNGEQFVIRLPQRYSNKQCGVCGHYNMDSGDELMTEGSGGRKQQASSLADFHSYYVHNGQQQGQQKHGECDPTTVAAKIRQQQQGQSGEDQQQDDAYSFKKKPKKMTQWSSSESREDSNAQSPNNNNANSAEEGSSNTNTNADNFFDDQVLGTNRQWDESDEKQEPYWSQEESNQQSTNSRQIVKARNATQVVERQSSVCFSAKPVPTCPPGSEPAPGQSEKKRIVFLCLPRYHAQVRQWMNAVRSAQGGITKLDVRGTLKQQPGGRYDEQESYGKSVWVPKQCVKAASTSNGWDSSSSTEY